MPDVAQMGGVDLAEESRQLNPPQSFSQTPVSSSNVPVSRPIPTSTTTQSPPRFSREQPALAPANRPNSGSITARLQNIGMLSYVGSVFLGSV